MLFSNLQQFTWFDTAPPIWGNRSPLAGQSKVGYRKHTLCASTSQCAWCGTDGTRGVGTLDPLLMGPSPKPSWMPDPMSIFTKGHLYTYTIPTFFPTVAHLGGVYVRHLMSLMSEWRGGDHRAPNSKMRKVISLSSRHWLLSCHTFSSNGVFYFVSN